MRNLHPLDGSAECVLGRSKIIQLRATKKVFSSERAWKSDENRISMAHNHPAYGFSIANCYLQSKVLIARRELGFASFKFQDEPLVWSFRNACVRIESSFEEL
jgi:hypothetical protein